MPVDDVGTGHPDGEARGMPMGATLGSGVGVTALTTGTLLISSGTTEVAAYRSIIVAVRNSGANDVQITPKWTLYDSSGQYLPTQTQTVKAGTSKMCLFQNQGDLLLTLLATGVGGNTTIEWLLAGSNLDPLPQTAPDFLILQGLLRAVNNPPVGDEDHGKFDAAAKFTNKSELWTYTLDAGGRIKEVHNTDSGLFDVSLNYKWAAPGAAAQMDALINVNPTTAETWNGVTIVGVSPDDEDTIVAPRLGFTRAVFPLSTLAARIWVQPVNGSGAAVDFTPVYLSIVRYPLPQAS